MTLKWTQQGISNRFLPWLTALPSAVKPVAFTHFCFQNVPHIETTVRTVSVQYHTMKKQQKSPGHLHRVTFIPVIWRVGSESLCGIGGALSIALAFWLKYSVTHPHSQSMTDWVAELWHCAAGAAVWALKCPVLTVALHNSIVYDIRTYLLFCTLLRSAICEGNKILSKSCYSNFTLFLQYSFIFYCHKLYE